MPKTTNATPRLRISKPASPFHVVLVAPEIPPNTGSVARLCAATGAPLHLVRPLGFSLDEKALRRAGVDYWHLVAVTVHEDLDAFFAAFAATLPPGASIGERVHLLTATAQRSYVEAPFRPGDALIFGRESDGLPDDLLARFPDRGLGIPTVAPPSDGDDPAAHGVRSLNLANAVGIVLFEALRSVGALGGATVR